MDGWLAPDLDAAGHYPAAAALDSATWAGEVPGWLELLLSAVRHSSYGEQMRYVRQPQPHGHATP